MPAVLGRVERPVHPLSLVHSGFAAAVEDILAALCQARRTYWQWFEAISIRALDVVPLDREEAMPKYQVYFDTVKGETCYNVDIDEEELLEGVLTEILFELRERGDFLRGDGEPQVVWNSQALDFNTPLPEQGVRPNDVLRVSTIPPNG